MEPAAVPPGPLPPASAACSNLAALCEPHHGRMCRLGQSGQLAPRAELFEMNDVTISAASSIGFNVATVASTAIYFARTRLR